MHGYGDYSLGKGGFMLNQGQLLNGGLLLNGGPLLNGGLPPSLMMTGIKWHHSMCPVEFKSSHPDPFKP